MAEHELMVQNRYTQECANPMWIVHEEMSREHPVRRIAGDQGRGHPVRRIAAGGNP